MRVSRTVTASSFTPLRDRQDEWRARLAMIREAQRFLYTSTYYVGPFAYGTEYLEALGEAAERGVDCTLVVDHFGQWLGASAWSTAEKAQVDDALGAAVRRGVRVVWTRPDSTLRRWVGGGHHVKIQVSEQGLALLASSNLAHHSFESWGEFSALLGGPIVRPLLEAIHAVIPDPEAAHLDALEGAGGDAGPLELWWWWCNPSADPGRFTPLLPGGANPITDGLVQAVEAAERTIALTSFYFKPTPSLRAALLRAAGRGVTVEVFHSGADALDGAEASWLAAAQDYPAWLAAGVHLYEVEGGEHSKLMLIDDRWATFGSYNLDNAAHDVVAEAMLATEAPSVVSAVAAVLDELRGDPRARRVPPDFRATWTLERKVRAWMVWPVRRWV